MKAFHRNSDTSPDRPISSEPSAQSVAAPQSAAPAFIGTVLFELLLLLLFVGGMFGCLITGFALPVYPSVLCIGIPLLCILQILCGRIGTHIPAVTVVQILLPCIWFWWRTEALTNGILTCAAAIFRYLCWGFPGIEMPDVLREHEQFLIHAETNDLLLASIRAPQTELFLFLTVLFGMLWFFLYRKAHNVWLSALLPLPAFILCFLIIETTIPALWALMTILLYWALLLFTRGAIRLHPRAAAAQAVSLLLPCLLFLSAVYHWYPQTTPVGELVQNGYDKVLTAISTAETSISQMATGVFSGGWFTVSAEGSEISFDSLNPRRFLGRTVMRAKCDTTGVVYLRENTYGSYTDRGWEQTVFDGIHASEPDPVIQTVSASILASSGISASRLTLDGARSPLLFTPYYFSDASAEYAFDSDSRITNPEHASDYEVSFYRFSGNFNDLQYATPSASAGTMLLSLYTQDTLPIYREIDEALASELRTILSENGIDVSTSYEEIFTFEDGSIRTYTDYDAMWETVADITYFVRSCAKYSLNADKNTTDRSFVLWFIEDAEYGYCTHFATAEVMLLRACGIPARLAAGFLGSIRSANTWTAIKDSNAHAWAEVFDRRLGWIPIEATPPSELSPDMDTDDIIVGMAPIPVDGETDAVTESTETVSQEEMSDTSAVTEALPPPSVDPNTTTEDQTPHGGNSNGSGSDSSGNTTGGMTEPFRTSLLPQIFQYTVIILAVLLSAAAVLFLAVLYRRIRLQRISALFSPDENDRNACTLRLYRRCITLARACGEELPAILTSLAEKARFSHHTLTQEELDILRVWYEEKCAYLQKQDQPLRRLRHFWIDLYY